MDLGLALLKIVHVLSFVILVGGLTMWVLCEAWARRQGWRAMATVNHAMVSTGVYLSVALGCAIFSGLGLYYIIHGSFSWSLGSPWQQWQLIKGLVFMAFWVHWGWTEVVTLNDIRRQTPDPAADIDAPDEAFDIAHTRGWRALRYLWLELLIIAGLGAYGGLLA